MFTIISMPHALGISLIENVTIKPHINASWIIMNDMNVDGVLLSNNMMVLDNIGFNITPTTPIDIDLYRLRLNSIRFTINSTGTYTMEVSNLTPDTDYYLYRDGVLNGTYPSGASGNITISLVTGSEHEFELETNGVFLWTDFAILQLILWITFTVLVGITIYRMVIG